MDGNGGASGVAREDTGILQEERDGGHRRTARRPICQGALGFACAAIQCHRNRSVFLAETGYREDRQKWESAYSECHGRGNQSGGIEYDGEKAVRSLLQPVDE